MGHQLPDRKVWRSLSTFRAPVLVSLALLVPELATLDCEEAVDLRPSFGRCCPFETISLHEYVYQRP